MEHNKQDIVQKIQQLAEERQIFAYAKACGVVAEQMTELAEQLAAIQYPIFVIDALYEQHRGITPQLQDQVDALRQEIELHTQALLPELRLRESYVQVLRNFWQMELGLRSGESLLHRTLDEIYQLKICDVQLQRACIRAFANKESAPPLLEAIRQYDMLGEVLDDLMDREEDRYTHNPNRFLAACDAWGSDHAVQEYTSFVEQGEQALLGYKQDLLGYGLQVDSYIGQIRGLLDAVTLG